MEIIYTNKVKPLSAPLYVNLLLTSRCNLECKHCFIPRKDRASRNELDLRSIKRLVKQLQEAKIFTIDIGGGEPLLRNDFFNILDVISKTKIKIAGLNTNAILMKKDAVKRLVQHDIGTYVVSLDGSNSRIYAKMRGRGEVFNAVIQGINNLLEKKQKVKISTIVTKCNFKDMEAIVLLGKRLGVDSVRFNHIFFAKPTLPYLRQLQLTPKEQRDSLKYILDVYHKWGSFVSGTYLEAENIRKKLKNISRSSKNREILPCPAGTTKAAIRADGWVIPCEILYHKKIGNIKERSFLDIWNDEQAWGEFRSRFEIKFGSEEFCSNCNYFSLCYQGHGCFPYYLPDEIAKKKPYCIIEDKSHDKISKKIIKEV